MNCSTNVDSSERDEAPALELARQMWPSTVRIDSDVASAMSLLERFPTSTAYDDLECAVVDPKTCVRW